MKKTTLIFSLLAIVLFSSCSMSFNNTKQHAHRNYIRIGPGIKTDTETSSLTNTIVEPSTSVYKNVTPEKETKAPANTEVKLNKQKPVKRNNTVSNVQTTKINHAPIVKKGWKKPPLKKGKTSGAKKTNGVGYFNIISFCFAMLELIALALYIAFYFALNVFGVIAMLIMMIVSGVLGIASGIIGLAMKQDQKKLGIAGIILCGIFLIIAIIDLVI